MHSKHILVDLGSRWGRISKCKIMLLFSCFPSSGSVWWSSTYIFTSRISRAFWTADYFHDLTDDVRSRFKVWPRKGSSCSVTKYVSLLNRHHNISFINIMTSLYSSICEILSVKYLEIKKPGNSYFLFVNPKTQYFPSWLAVQWCEIKLHRILTKITFL